MYRNYKLNELRIENVGEEVVLSGWVSKVRDLGHFTFIDLRDRYGITQILVNEEVSGKELFEEARKLKNKAPNLYIQNLEMKYCDYLENKILK